MPSKANSNASATAYPSRVDKLAADFFGTDETHRTATVSGPPPYMPSGHNVIETREPPTLARMFFMYGFREFSYIDILIFLRRCWETFSPLVFFPFWLVGISILFLPLSPTPDWESGKSEVERAKLLHIHRETEKKWARRCLMAMSGFSIIVIILAVIIKFGIMASAWVFLFFFPISNMLHKG